MSDRNHPGAVEDYTQPFLVMLGVLIFMLLWVVSARAGGIWMIATAIALDRLIALLPRRDAGRRSGKDRSRQ